MLVSLFGVSLFGLVGLAEWIFMPWARRGVAEK